MKRREINRNPLQGILHAIYVVRRLLLIEIPYGELPILRRSFLLILFSISLTPYSVQAQVTQRHNCWDIDMEEDLTRPPYLTPHSIAKADTGLMLVAMAKEYIGTPYRYAGRSPKGFDCAGFALYLYRHFGHDLPGWSGAQAMLGIEVNDTRNLQPGDLVFFGGRHHTKTIGHTGIAIQTDPSTGIFTFIHASTTNGVIISRSTEPYYAQRYLTARRIFK